MEEKITGKVTKERGKAKNRKKKPVKRGLLLLLFLLLGVVLLFLIQGRKAKKVSVEGEKTIHTQVASRGDIYETLSSSGTLEAKDTYSITSLIDGEVLEAKFEEGDLVEKGQVLYRIDSSSLQTQLDSANSTLERAQSKYQDAISDYQDAAAQYQSRIFPSKYTGYVKTLYVEAGDKVTIGTKIADIYSDKKMELKVPFLTNDAASISVGDEAVITLEETLETLTGNVTKIQEMEEVLTGGRLVRYVTVEVENPGGLSTSTVATVAVNGIVGAAEATFEATVERELVYQLNEGVTIENLSVSEGDAICEGQSIFTMTVESVEEILGKYQDSMEEQQDNVDQAKNSLDTTSDKLEDYVITAPISGKVIQKNTKVGDNAKSDSSNAMALIYDLSSLTFSMSVDETEVSDIEVGQEVQVTADAFPEEVFTGIVTNVSLKSTSSQGVTNYPVTVLIEDTKNLLPGMNVDGEIIIDSATDVVMIPSGALQRGNRVYVKDDSVTEKQEGAPAAGFRTVEVETGLISNDYVEILSGIEEGDEVYVAEEASSMGAMSFMTPNMGAMPGGGQMGRGSGGDHGEGNRP